MAMASLPTLKYATEKENATEKKNVSPDNSDDDFKTEEAEE